MPEATLRINPGPVDPKSLSARLGLQPTHVVVKGELSEPGMLDSMAKESAWSLSSKDQVQGEATAHLAWLMERIATKGSEISDLQELGVAISLELTLDGSGGRSLMLPQPLLRKLYTTGLDVRLNFPG